jgi:predicted metal-dependent HD superfamily phosphohydrolase
MGNPDPDFVRRAIREDAECTWEDQFPDGGHTTVLAELIAAYDAPDRHYHNLDHLRHCFYQLRRLRALLDDVRAVEAAIWFHDVVYDPTRDDNEERSAAFAAKRLAEMGRSEAFITTVRQLILDTRHRERPTTSDGRYLVDIDLSILGQPARIYDLYDQNIRLEYAHVPEDAYRAGRAKVLNAFLSRPNIFATDAFRERYEVRARENLGRSIARLLGDG